MATKKRKPRKRAGWGTSHRGSSPMVPRKRGGSKRPSLAKRLEKHGKTAKERADYVEYDRRCKAAAREVWG
mgnify:FL=1